MTALTYPLRDSITMLRRDVLHSLRFPLMTISSLTVPIFILLLFDGVFGNTLRAGLGSAGPADGHYIDYLAPGILVMTASSAAQATALNVCTDMTEGIISRFRTMAISRTSVLTGQVLGSLLRTMISGALVLAVAVGLGFRPTATAGDWVAATARLRAADDRRHVADRCLRARREDARRREQPVADRGLAAVRQQRVRPHGLDARRRALVRGVSTVHADHPDAARPAHRHADRPRRGARRRLVRRHRRRGVPLGPRSLRPAPGGRMTSVRPR